MLAFILSDLTFALLNTSSELKYTSTLKTYLYTCILYRTQAIVSSSTIWSLLWIARYPLAFTIVIKWADP